MKITQIFDDNRNILATDVWITKKGSFRYVTIDIAQKGKSICPICQEKHKLRAHHVIPKRLKTDYMPLKEVRIRICSGCHNKIHPENVLIIGMRKLITIIDDLTDGKADEMDVIKEFKEVVYNRKNANSVPYNHLDRINENIGRIKCL